MLEFFRSGGWSMFVVLFLGVTTLIASLALLRKPAERHIGAIRALSAATVFSILSGVTSDLAAVFTQVPNREEWAHSPDMPLIVMTGLGESLAPAILGFTLLTLAWLVTAAGMRRLGADLGAA